MTIFTNVSLEHYNYSLGIFWALAYVKKKPLLKKV